MSKLETQLKQQGWEIKTFQPTGEKYPWSLKISKKINTKGLHSDDITTRIRESQGYFIITAYLDIDKKLDVKNRDARITSALRWELTKNYTLLTKYAWLSDLQKIVGPAKNISSSKKVIIQNQNKPADIKVEQLEIVKKSTVSTKKSSTKTSKISKSVEPKPNVRKSKPISKSNTSKSKKGGATVGKTKTTEKEHKKSSKN